MESERGFSLVWLLIALLYSFTTLNAASVSDRPVYSELNGNVLIKMGNDLNKPLLTLLGKTLLEEKERIEKEQADRIGDVQKNLNKTVDEMKNKVERETWERIDNVKNFKNFKDEIRNLTDEIAKDLCELEKCTTWSEWSECSAIVNGTFGVSTRSRTCGISTSLCPSNDTEKVEMDSKICQGSKCKSTYTLTENQFCIRLSHTVQKTWQSARDECQQDGGQLINIDSEMKARDVNETLVKMSMMNKSIWIDGTRTLLNGERMNEFEPQDPWFFMTSTTTVEPGSSNVCRIYYGRSWYGRSCNEPNYFLCEIS